MISRRTCREEVTRKIEQMVVKVELTEIWNHVMDWIYFVSCWVSLADLCENGNECRKVQAS